MFSPFLLLFAAVKLVLADDNHQEYECYNGLQDACPTVDQIEIKVISSYISSHYCDCDNANRNYQITFKVSDEVTSFNIPSQFFVNSRIASLTIPAKCSSIEAGAFYGSTITNIAFETGAQPNLYHDCFGSVTFINDISLPNSMTQINSNVFYDTTFNGNFILPDNLNTINDYAFYKATFNKGVTFKSKVVNIYSYAFYFAKFRNDVKFENQKTNLSPNVFMNATFSGTLNLPTDLTTIPSSIFESAEFGTSFTVPIKVQTIYGKAFQYSQFKGNLVLPNSLKNINQNAFQEAKFEGSITFQNPESTIQNDAFKAAEFGQSLTLPTKLETILSSTFQNAVFHSSIIFPNTLETISSNAFQGAQFGDTISLPDSLKTISTSAFESCIFNTETVLNFGKSCETIGNYAFQNSNLQSISFNQAARLETIGKEAFEGLFQLRIVGDSRSLYSETISQSAFEGDENIDFTSITSKTIDNSAFKDCFNIVVSGGILILADGLVQTAAFLNCRKLNGPLTMYKSNSDPLVSTIGSRAFENTGITYLNLPHIVSIDDKAFYNCVLLQGPINETYEELYVDTISTNAFDGDTLLHFTTIKSEYIDNYAFQFCRNLSSNIVLLGKEQGKSITLGNVGQYSFYSCDKLGNLTFDLSLLNDFEYIPSDWAISIPKYAFAKSGLNGPLNIPSSVNQISEYAFSNCPNIKNISINRQYSIPLKIEDHAFANSDIGSDLVIPKYVTDIIDYSFANTSIETLTIEGTSYTKYDSNDGFSSLKTTVKLNAFKDCTKLQILILGNESIDIESDAFRGCHVKSLQLGNVNTIPNDAFIGMSLIDNAITIPDSVASIGSRAFSECYNIPSITISPNSNLKTIGEAAFYKCKKIESIVIPPGVTEISEYAFYQCDNLKTITILSHTREDESSISIGAYAFYGCFNLKETLSLPEGLEKIGEGAFQGCKNLEGTLTFPYSLTEIGERAFADCRSLTGGLTFDINVEQVGKYAFRDCKGLNGEFNIIDYYGEKTYEIHLHEGAFYGCSNLKGDLNIPIRCLLKKPIYNNAGEIVSYETSNNVFKGCSGFHGTLSLPKTITEIPDGTFCDCSNLKGEIKDDLKIIGNQAFKNCFNLTGSVDLTNYDYSKDIGSYAFYNCIGLNGQLIFKELSEEVFIHIGEYAFYHCNGLTGPLNCSSLSIIGSHAFTGCSGLNGSLNFGVYLLKVGDHAFEDCTGFSNTLSFRSLMDNELSIEESAFKGCTGFKDGTLLFYIDRSNSKMKPSYTYYLKIERNAFEKTKFKDIRYIGRDQPYCDCDIGLPSRKGIHTSSNYDGTSFCGNPLHKSKLSGGAIAGIVIACIVVVAVIVFLIVFFILKNKKNKDKSEGEVEMNQDP